MLMRLILATDDQERLSAVAELLHANSIPVHEPAKYSDVPGFRVGANVRSLYVWLDYHYDDAIKLLHDPEKYVVKNPVDRDEFDRVQKQIMSEATAAEKKRDETVVNWLVGVGVVALAGVGVYRIFFK